MKLQRQAAYKQKGQTYYKYVVTLPPDTIEKLGWKQGTELKAEARNGKILLEPT